MRIALYEPDIPQNTGNILRLGACLGLDIDIIEPTGYIFNDKRFKRSSMDYIKHIEYKRHLDWDSFSKWVNSNNFRLILLTTKSNRNYYDYSFKENDILLFGRESAGVPQKVHDEVDETSNEVEMDPKDVVKMAMQTQIVQATYSDMRKDLPELKRKPTI